MVLMNSLNGNWDIKLGIMNVKVGMPDRFGPSVT
jgi:hypothetical protein